MLRVISVTRAMLSTEFSLATDVGPCGAIATGFVNATVGGTTRCVAGTGGGVAAFGGGVSPSDFGIMTAFRYNDHKFSLRSSFRGNSFCILLRRSTALEIILY